MAEVINLRQFRKRKKREERDAKADANRNIHGISSKLKKLATAKTEKEADKLDGKKLSTDE